MPRKKHKNRPIEADETPETELDEAPALSLNRDAPDQTVDLESLLLDMAGDAGLSLFDDDEDGDAPRGKVDMSVISMGQMEENLQTGVSEILSAFQKSARGEYATRDANINTRFWLALAFQSEEAKNEFLLKSGWIDFGNKYLCGEEIANHMGIPMEIPIPGMPNWKHKASLAAMTADGDRREASDDA